MRARNIKPGLWKDEDLASLPMAARYLFPGLWCLADCVGRLEDRPRLIKAELFPFDDDISAATVHHLLQQLHDAGFIQRYEIGANRYIQVVNFEKHQNPHKNEKEKGSQIPEPTRVVPVPNLSEPVPIKSEQGPNNSKPLGLIPSSLIPSSLIPESGKMKPPISTGTVSGLTIARQGARPPGAPSWDAINSAWKWYKREYPTEVNDFTELQLFISVMETEQDLTDIRTNLPLWKKSQKWREGFVHSSKNFISERIFKILPKDPVKSSGTYDFPDYFDPKTITGPGKPV